MGYPLVLTNPQRPESHFTEQTGGTEGRYLTPTGEQIYFDALQPYVLSGHASLPSAADVRQAQRALGMTESGQLDADTMAGVVNVQIAMGLLTTGVPDATTLQKMAGMTGGAADKKKKGGGSEVLVLGVAALAHVFLFRGD